MSYDVGNLAFDCCRELESVKAALAERTRPASTPPAIARATQQKEN